MKLKFFIFFITIFWLQYCNHGLSPIPRPAGISGIITYQNWPPPDSIKILKLVVFRNFPPGNIIEEVQSKRAIYYPTVLTESLPQFVDSTEYRLALEPGVYEYIVIAQQYGEIIETDWRVVGQYDTTAADTLPSAITVLADSILKDININVDFMNLPIQPF